MKGLFKWIVLPVVILIGVALGLPSVIPSSAYRDQVQTAAHDALDRDVIFDGDISISLLPRIEVRATQVSIANAEGYGDDPFASMSEMRVAVKLIPLFSGNIEIDEFVLIDPSINLEQRGARNNWTFAGDETANIANVSGTGFIRQVGALPFESSFGDVSIQNANLIYRNGAETQSITGLDMSIDLPSMDAPVRISGALSANGTPLTFNAQFNSMRDFFEGRETPLSFSLGGRLITARFEGAIPAGEDIAITGALTSNIPSLRALADFAGTQLPEGEKLQNFSAAGDIEYRENRLTIDNADIELDDISATGNVVVNLAGRHPSVIGNLNLPTLDITPYLPVSEDTVQTRASGPSPWSAEPVDMGFLELLDTDLRMNVGQLKFQELEVSDAALRVQLIRGRLSANLENFNLYSGTGSAVIVANNRGNRPSYSLNATLSGLDALPFMEAAAGFDRLEGIGELQLNILATGNSVDEIMNSLSGDGRFNFSDGAIVGINLAEVIRNIESAISSGDDPEGVGEDEQTDFSSLGGSFSLRDGLASNTDFLMLSPLIRVEGSGRVDLGAQTIDYRLRPRAVASIQGQGGDRDLRGITIPIRVRGPFHDISMGIDTEAVGQALLRGVVGRALGVEDSGSTEDILRDGLLNALGLGGSNSDAEEAPADDNPDQEVEPEEELDPAERLLRDLFNPN